MPDKHSVIASCVHPRTTSYIPAFTQQQLLLYVTPPAVAFPWVRYAVDTFRWYICREAIFGSDLAFSKRALVLAHNSELCNTFGNLVHRSLSLMHKYNDGEWSLVGQC